LFRKSTPWIPFFYEETGDDVGLAASAETTRLGIRFARIAGFQCVENRLCASVEVVDFSRAA
jgi:hypothetical protein